MRSEGSPLGRRAQGPRARDGWSVVLSWSVLAAAAVHAMVFALAPGWKVPIPFARAGAGVALIRPVSAPHAGAGTALGGPARPQEARETEARTVHREAAFVAEGEEAPPAFVPPVPSIVEPPQAVPPSRAPRMSPRMLEHRVPLHAQIESASPAGLWRDIQNVDQVLQFLRRSNRILEATGARGHTVIEVWVDARGRVAHSEVRQSSGQAALDRIALELFEEVVRFERRGGAVLTSALISIPFEGRW